MGKDVRPLLVERHPSMHNPTYPALCDHYHSAGPRWWPGPPEKPYSVRLGDEPHQKHPGESTWGFRTACGGVTTPAPWPRPVLDPEGLRGFLDYYRTQVDPDVRSRPVMILEPYYWSVRERAEVASVFLDVFRFPALCFFSSEVAACYSAGLMSGMVVDVGWNATTVAPVVDGVVMRSAASQSPVGGRLLSELLYAPVTAALQRQGKSWACLDRSLARGTSLLSATCSFRQYHVARAIEEMTGWAACWRPPEAPEPDIHIEGLSRDPGRSFKPIKGLPEAAYAVMERARASGRPPAPPEGKGYTLPDGTVVDVSTRCDFVLSGLFDPAHLRGIVPRFFENPNTPLHSLQYSAYQGVSRYTSDVQVELLSNIVAVGGLAGVPGLATRLEGEFSSICPPYLSATVVNKDQLEAGESYRYASWEGGSAVAATPIVDYLWVSRSEFEEYGPVLLERRHL